jgi:AcrR family transcriptional regulator
MAIAAGRELIEEKGFSGFSARGVAARIGYTVGTIYHLFGDLDNFVLHINATTLEEWRYELQEALSRTRGNKVHALARCYLEFARANFHRFTALYEHHLSAGAEVPEWYAEKMNEIFTVVESALSSFLPNGKKAKRAAKILWAGVHGICILALSGKLDVVRSDTAEVMLRDFVEIFMTGITEDGRRAV